jgi:hypothetical protein
MEWIANKFEVKEMEDWYSVSGEQIAFHGGSALLKKHGGFRELLQKVFPSICLFLLFC